MPTTKKTFRIHRYDPAKDQGPVIKDYILDCDPMERVLTALNRIKEKSLLDGANSARRIEDAEQEVWLLTAGEAPDGAKIEAKVRAIESSRGDQRMAFIRAVGEAGKVLTAGQQTALLGTNPMPATKSTPAAGKPAPMPATPAPMKME